MATWVIGTKDAATEGLSGLAIRKTSRSADVASVVHDGASYDADPMFSYGPGYDITFDGVRVFAGVCVTVPREGTGKAEAITYEFRGGWYWLEKIMYTQKWKKGTDNSTSSKTRVLLGYNDSAEKISCNAQLTAILACAIAAGAPLAIGTISVSGKVLPHDEQVDLTCADAINRLLAWFPDTAVWVDYSQATPTIHMVRRASLTPVSVATANLADKVSISPRYDAQVPGVRIIYEIVSASGTGRVLDVVEDTAGWPTAMGAMVYTVQLSGGSVRYLWQRVKVDGYTPKILTSADAKTWWAAKLPHLAGWSDVTLHDASPSWPPEVDLKTCDNELQDGEIQPWMTAFHATNVTAQVKADYTLNGKTIKDQILSCNLTMTNASTGLFNVLESQIPPDEVPTGLAAEVFAAVGTLHYEGKITLVADEPPATVMIGNVLNLTGGRTAWTTMAACVQAVDMDVDNGTTVISFGPPEHLGVADLVQLALANSKRKPTISLGSKLSSAISDSDDIVGGEGAKGDSAAGGERLMKLVIGDPSGDHITLDPAATPVEVTVLTGASISGNNIVFTTKKLTFVSAGFKDAAAGSNVTLEGGPC